MRYKCGPGLLPTSVPKIMNVGEGDYDNDE